VAVGGSGAGVGVVAAGEVEAIEVVSSATLADVEDAALTAAVSLPDATVAARSLDAVVVVDGLEETGPLAQPANSNSPKIRMSCRPDIRLLVRSPVLDCR